MQRHAVVVLTLIACLLAGCGSSKKTTTTGNTITISPSAPSLDVGRFTALTATITDSSGVTITNLTPTWSSSNTAIVDVSTNGAICAGKWDSETTPTICTPGPVGSAVITASAGGVSGTVTVSTHVHIARLIVGPTGSGCTSQGQTQQFFAVAFDGSNQDITNSVGAVTFTTSDSTVGTIDANALVTAKRPGSALVNASVSGVNGLPASFITCPPASIVIGQQATPSVTDFTVASAQTTILAATVTDTKGNPITDLALTFLSSAPGVASVATSSLTATVTANAAGRVGVVASCTPTACNPAVNRPIYSNVATFTVTGSTSPKVVAASANSNTVAIIDSTNAVIASPTIPSITNNGTAATPILNSVVISGDGNKAFFGSNLGVLTLDLTTNAFLTNAFLFGGKVMAASQDGTKLLVTDGGSFSVIDASASQSNTYPILNATAADLSIDAVKLLAVSGNTLNTVNRVGITVSPITLAASGSDVKFLQQGSVAFVAEPGANAQIFATCDNSSLGNVAAQPQLLASSSDSARMFGANTTTVFSITPTISQPPTPTATPTSCAPPTSTAVASTALGATVSPRQVLAAQNASRAVVLGDVNSVFVYNNTANTVNAVALTDGGNSTTGGITPDGATLYVGTTAGNVQRIDLAGGVVLQSIAAGLKNGAGTGVAPDFVAVRPK